MRLRTTLFAMLVVIAIVLSGTVYAGFALHQSNTISQHQEQLDTAAETVAANVDDQLRSQQTLVRLYSREPEAGSHGTTTQQALLGRFVADSRFDGASIVDASGTMRAIDAEGLDADDRADVLGDDFSERAYVQHALNGEIFISDPFTAETGNDIIIISAPIRDDSGEIVGVFSGSLHLDRTTFFEPTHDVIADDTVVTVRSNGGTLYESAAKPNDALTAEATAAETDWTVVVTQDRSPLDQRLWRTTLVQTAAVVLALLSVLAVGVWISKTTLQSLEELIRGMGQLQEGNYDTELQLGATDEWVQLRQQFNELAAALDQRESQLRVLNRVLRHNLRNDMSVVIAHSDTILHNEPAEDVEGKVQQIRQTAVNLIETSEHARTIYDKMLATDDRDPEPVDVALVVEQRLVKLQENFPDSTIETHLPDSAWALGGDVVPIIVDELCRNALVHNDRPEDEREVAVTVEGGVAEGEVCIVVRDNGPGLPDVERELLTGEREASNVEHGSGLGLWVVSWLVDQCDGTVTTANRADRGTTVTVTLPAPPEIPDENRPGTDSVD